MRVWAAAGLIKYVVAKQVPAKHTDHNYELSLSSFKHLFFIDHLDAKKRVVGSWYLIDNHFSFIFCLTEKFPMETESHLYDA